MQPRFLSRILNIPPDDSKPKPDKLQWQETDEEELLKRKEQEEEEEEQIKNLAAEYKCLLRAEEESAFVEVNQARDEIRKEAFNVYRDAYEYLLEKKARELAKKQVASLRELKKAEEAERKRRWEHLSGEAARRNRPPVSPPRKIP